MVENIDPRLHIEDECVGCTKRGMEAVYCPIQTLMSEEVFKLVQCSDVYTDEKKAKGVSGGKYNYKPRKKPKNGSRYR